jgi:hypothetical protein
MLSGIIERFCSNPMSIIVGYGTGTIFEIVGISYFIQTCDYLGSNSTRMIDDTTMNSPK